MRSTFETFLQKKYQSESDLVGILMTLRQNEIESAVQEFTDCQTNDLTSMNALLTERLKVIASRNAFLVNILKLIKKYLEHWAPKGKGWKGLIEEIEKTIQNDTTKR